MILQKKGVQESNIDTTDEYKLLLNEHEEEEERVQQESFWRNLRGILASALSTLLFFGCILAMKEGYIAYPFLSGIDFLLAECVIQPILIPLAAHFLGQKGVHRCPQEGRKYLIAMCALSTLGNALHFSSIAMLPVSKATLISNIRPIFVAILCFFFLKERLHLADVLLIIASFGGVALVTL